MVSGTNFVRRHYILVSVALFLLLLNVFFYYFSPEKIVDYVGVENSYLVVFLISSIGGLSSITGPVLFTAIATFAAGGSSPLILGFIGGAGIFLSDSIFFMLARWGRKHVPEEWESAIKRVESFLNRYSEKKVMLFTYLYISFVPLPNDVLMLALALAGYRYKKLFPFILLGSITVAIITAYIGYFFL